MASIRSERLAAADRALVASRSRPAESDGELLGKILGRGLGALGILRPKRGERFDPLGQVLRRLPGRAELGVPSREQLRDSCSELLALGACRGGLPARLGDIVAELRGKRFETPVETVLELGVLDRATR